MKKGSEKHMIFEWLEPRKVSPRRGESMILMFYPSPEKPSILGLFWYLLLELLGSPIVENVVFKGASFLFVFYIDFYTILNPQNLPPRHVKWGFIFGTIFDKPVLASEREARLIRRVLLTCARNSHRPSHNLHIFQYVLNEESLPNTA